MSTGDLNSVIDQLDSDSTLSFAGRALKLDSEKDAQEIVDAITDLQNLNNLELKGNTIGVKSAKAIGIALEKHPEFKRALWSDIFTGRLKTEIPDALKFMCGGIVSSKARLVELDLSDNAFGPNGMIGLMDFLKSPSCYTLQVLRLNNNGLGIQGGKMLADCLEKCHTSSVEAGTPLALRVFVSGRGRLEDEGATALSRAFQAMRSLEEVHMPQNGINFKGITALAEAFSDNKNLRHINLSDNTFTEKGSKPMARALASLQHLEVINFEDCLIRTGGAMCLADILKDGHTHLKILKLSGNEISAEGAVAIVEAMKNKDLLESLHLNANNLGSTGISTVQDMMEANGRHDALETLSDDEGSEEDDENEDVSDEEDEVEPEDDEEGEEIPDSTLEIRGQAITPRAEPKSVTPGDFLLFPSPLKLRQIGDNRAQIMLDHLGNDVHEPEMVVQTFIKLSLVVTPSDEETKADACKCADAILSAAFDVQVDNTTADPAAAVCNTLLVHLGLIKSEDRTFKPVNHIDGALIILEHAVRQKYFPTVARDMLKFFLHKRNAKIESIEARQHLLKALDSL